jgi:dihydroorotase
MLDLIIKNGQCYIDGQLKDADVAVKDGKIHKIGEISEEAKEVINAEGPNSFARMYRYSNTF